MKNDYFFWDEYLKETIKKMEELIFDKDCIYTDFHMHSDYSADGKQNLEEIISRANELGLDIIAITDHDSIEVYDDLFKYLKTKKIKTPIIVPGIEFTIDNKEYGSQCHILQLMINPKDEELIKNVAYNEAASWRRVDKQFERISQNMSLQFFFKKYNISCSKQDYRKYLQSLRRPIPEYATIMQYLMKILISNNVTTWDLFYKLKEDNQMDKCQERKILKENRYKILEERYQGESDSYNSVRFLHSMLAVKGVDDDFFQDYQSCGSLSVNNYGQLKLEQLNQKYITIIAHPNEEKLEIIDKLLKLDNNIIGLELNRQTKYKNLQSFYDKLEKFNMIKIIGSDSHSLDSEWYKDINFYITSKSEVKNFLTKSKDYIKFA